MSAIVSAKMDAWGLVDHGLKKSVKYQWILFACFILEIVRDVAMTLNMKIIAPLIVTLAVAAMSVYAYNKLDEYSKIFTTVMFLMLASLALKIMISYLNFGVLFSYPMYLIQLVVSVCCYKMNFDAYAELISPVDVNLEKKWLKMWPLTLILYIVFYIGVVVGAFNGNSVLAQILAFVPPVLLNIITPILMVATIKVCMEN